jgi:hypothetical protein
MMGARLAGRPNETYAAQDGIFRGDRVQCAVVDVGS